MPNPAKINPKITISFLVLIFAVPLVTAHALYHYRDRFSFKTVEAGILLSPPLAANTFDFFDPTFLGKWQLVSLKTNDVAGEKALSILKGIHTALGKEKGRVEVRLLEKTQAPAFLQEQFVLIDPKGWIILHYPENAPPQGILRDIRHLLKVSHGG